MPSRGPSSSTREVLLLDEPLSNLDTSLRDIVRVEVREIQKSLGITTIYVTHDQVEALSISDKVVVLRAGKIMAVGTPREIYTRPRNEFIASFVGKANMLSGTITSMAGMPTTRSGESLVIVETKFGEVRCHLHGAVQVKEGDRAIVTIKPENVILSADGQQARRRTRSRGGWSSLHTWAASRRSSSRSGAR